MTLAANRHVILITAALLLSGGFAGCSSANGTQAMNPNDERSDCEWSKYPMAQCGPLLVGDEATEEPRDFVALVSRGPCGANGQMIHVVNRHGSRLIFVTVRTRWVYQNEPRSRTDTYPLEPGAEAQIGCTVPGPTGQRFDRDITGARFG